MVKVHVNYNPYLVKTIIKINEKEIGNESPFKYMENKRLQEWIEPKGGWEGFFQTLRIYTGERELHLAFTGTFGDYDDLNYAREKFGKCFQKIELVHKNRESAKEADPYQKIRKLEELYRELQNGPIEEFKTEDIQRNFEMALNAEFRIIIVAPMSSGKSTLINAIIGLDLLPAVNQATTAVITEIKDNDNYPDFFVNASDKYGNVIKKNEKATKNLISELNYMKDPQDIDGKDALIRLIQIEGPIPNLSSKVLNTVFVDTPGGNNSQNDEHEEMMDEAIADENKSLILYVFNGTQLSTDDSDKILKKIANAMQCSSNGKQSRDRFIFVANRMDDFDVSEEPYEDVIEKTILPMLSNNGITEPNLFLASAQCAKLIRMDAGEKEELSETEEEDLEKLVKRFNRETRILPKFASLRETLKKKLVDEAKECAKKAKEEDLPKKEEKALRYRAAEINSGIPAIEMAIREYLEKYAISIKIKTLHDTFMGKVKERKMIDNCKAEWTASEANFKEIKRELEEKRKKKDHNRKLQELREKVESIQLETKGIKFEQAKVTKRINDLVELAKEQIRREEADYILALFRQNLQSIGEDAQEVLHNALNNGVRKLCQKIVNEYAEYIKELDEEGFFRIGSFDVKQTDAYSFFKMDRPEDVLQKDMYMTSRNEQVGTKMVKKKGIFAGIARVFGGGYETVGVYREQEYVLFKKLVQEQVTEIQHSFDKEVNVALKNTEKQVDELKRMTMSKLEGIDKMVSDLIEEIEKMTCDRELLRKQVKENEKKTRWIEEFVNKMENLLTV